MTIALLCQLLLAPSPPPVMPAIRSAGPTPAVSRVDIRGQVMDSLSGLPLASAVVRLVELERRADTHADGRFVLAAVPAGTWTLLVSRLGYRPVRRTVTLGDSDLTGIVVRLVPAALELPGIVVTGGLRAQESEEAVQPVSVVGGRRLDRQLAGTLGELLDKEPGVATVSMGPASARPIIRGVGGDRVLLLEDGARTGDMSYSSSDHAVTTDPGSVERVEVVRGPAALLYGSNALSGVVNIIREEIPTSHPEGLHGRVTLHGQSSTRSGFAGVELTAPLGALALRLEGSARGGGDLATPAGRVANTDLRTFVAGAGAGLARNWGHAGASVRHYNSSYGIPGGFVGGHEEGVSVDMRRSTVRAELHRQLGTGFLTDLEANGGAVHYAHEEIEEGGILGTAFRLATVDASLIVRHGRLGPMDGGGFGVRGQHRDFAYGGSLRTPDAREWSGAIYFLEELQRGRLRLQAGGRYDLTRIEPNGAASDVPSRTFGALSGSVGALVDLGRGVAVGTNLGRAFRTPDINDLYSNGPHLAAYREEIGNPDLDLEQGLGVDAFIRLNAHGVRTELAIFRNQISQFIYPQETGDTSQRNLPIAQYVGQDATLFGGEFRISASTSRHLVLDATASYVRGTLSDLDLPLPLIPPLRGSVDVRYERTGWFAGTGLRLAASQDRLGEYEERTDGYALVDLVGGVRWPWFGRLHAITVRLDNATNATWRDHLSRLKTIMPGPSRNLSLLYRAEF